MRILFDLFTDFFYTHFADIRVIGKHRYLFYKGYRFYRKWSQNEHTYWKCSKYRRHSCDARISSRMIGGYEKMKVSKAIHSHAPECSADPPINL